MISVSAKVFSKFRQYSFHVADIEVSVADIYGFSMKKKN